MFNRDAFIADIADSATGKLEEFRNDPKSCLAEYDLEITDDQAEKIKALNAVAKLLDDVTLIASPVQDV